MFVSCCHQIIGGRAEKQPQWVSREAAPGTKELILACPARMTHQAGRE